MEDLMTEETERLKRRNAELLKELQRLKRKPEGKIGIALLGIGIILIGLSIFHSNNTAGFLGIALTFWGAILTYVRPTRFVRNEVLDSAVGDSITNIQRLLNDLKCKGVPRYISPGTLLGLRTAMVYIPMSEPSPNPSDEELSKASSIIESPPGFKVTPPGLGLSILMEEEIKKDFSTIDLKFLQHDLYEALVEGLEIVEDFDMEISKTSIRVNLKGNLFYKITEEIEEQDIPSHLGDPLSSALACIFARTTREPISIEKIEMEPKTHSIQVIYKIGLD